MSDCVFCEIVAGRADATVLREWEDAIAIVPAGRGPIVEDGHFLVIPRAHVKDALADPVVAGMVMARTAELARDLGWTDANLAFNVGEFGGQTVPHIHGHGVRADELHRHTMPWFGQQLRGGRAFYVGRDGHGDLWLWTGDPHRPTPVAARHQLDDMDPLLWPLITTVLAPTHLDGEQNRD